MIYAIKVNRLGSSKIITLPAHLCRALGFVIGDTMLMQPLIDGTVVIYPPKLIPEVLAKLKHPYEEQEATSGQPS